MWDANVGTTTRVLDAAEKAGTPRIVYVSTVNVFGNTHGRDRRREDTAGTCRPGFLSWYDETKYGAHEVAEQRIAGGAPIIIVLPSQVYGSGDRSSSASSCAWRTTGGLAIGRSTSVGVGLIHVDDLAAGIVAALDRGRVGQSYILGRPADDTRRSGRASPRGSEGVGLRGCGCRPRLVRALAPAGRPDRASRTSASSSTHRPA